jgi:hypothetical protein
VRAAGSLRWMFRASSKRPIIENLHFAARNGGPLSDRHYNSTSEL